VQSPKLDRYLAANAELRPVLEKAREIAALSKLCAEILPPAIARDLRVANLKDGTLVLLAPNSAAAAKLKLLSEPLCNFLFIQGTKVKSLSVRVQPNGSRRERDAASHKEARFTAEALAELKKLCDRLGDSPARDALHELLAHHGVASEPAGSSGRKRRSGAGPGRRRRRPG
jgi:hypothetical protein